MTPITPLKWVDSPSGLEVGDRARFFDYRPWQKAGGDDPKTHNDQYFLPATIIKVYGRPGYDELVDIIFDHQPDRVSFAHFTNLIKDRGMV